MARDKAAKVKKRMGRRRRVGIRLIAYPGVLMLGWFLFGVSGCAESFFMYQPSRAAFTTPDGYEDVEFQTKDGLTLHGWFMPARGVPDGSRSPAVLHVHGNGGNLSAHASFSHFLPDAGMSVFIFDFRSYGRSDRAKGMLNRNKLLVDANAALDYLITRSDVNPDQVSVLGMSMGGVIGMSLAAERDEVKRIASVSAFSSWNQIASDHLGFFGRMVATRGLDAEEAASRLGARQLLIVHGKDDSIVPVNHASTIDAAAKSVGIQTRLLIVDGRDHNDILGPGSSESAEVARFFRHGLPGQ